MEVNRPAEDSRAEKPQASPPPVLGYRPNEPNSVLRDEAESMLPDHPSLHIELMISNILRVGVLISIALVVIGTTVSFIHHGEFDRSQNALAALTTPGARFPHTLRSVLGDLAKFRGRAIVVLGLICLIATPVIRVAVSIFAFVIEKDRTFIIVTSIVLTLLILSFFLGKAG